MTHNHPESRLMLRDIQDCGLNAPIVGVAPKYLNERFLLHTVSHVNAGFQVNITLHLCSQTSLAIIDAVNARGQHGTSLASSMPII
jgi:hypothetical protein